MTITIGSVLCLVLVGFLWGATNPLMKIGAQGIEKVRGSSFLLQFFNEICFLVTNFNYMMPFLLNQCGSVLYFFSLQNVDLSLAVPVANSLTFVFTAISGWFLGEKQIDKSTFLGMVLILSGITLCSIDKMNSISPSL